MKAISFLGFTKYQDTTYLNPINGKGFTTPFFQEALVEFYQPKTLYVLLTKTVETCIPRGATETNWSSLQKLLADKVDLQPIYNVPQENSTDDIWKLFEILTSRLQPNDHVVFDITHGFRSLPVLALIAVSYLRVVRNVKIEGLVYGAWEARNKETNESPTFDLMPIVSLLEWTTATDQFIKTGNGQALASLLHNSNTKTEHLATSINDIAQGLRLLRPMDVMREAASLPNHIAEATPIVSKSIPPFATLLGRVEKDYGNFGLANPDEHILTAKASLLRQLEMVKWYAEKGQTVQALSMAREWLPSLLCYHFSLDPQVEKPNRAEMELLLAGGKLKDQDGNTIQESLYLEQWSNIQKNRRKQLNNLWGGQFNLANLRNDVLHSGFRKKPKSAEDIVQQTKEIVEELHAIALVWGLVQDES
ncbi:TIGR02221 family CRISPR-associated protein [Lyngbya aestuarii]|uniref:TIGR02221 family CRISPR-associated protein n=1 Tax=Lyngbya aestuarii TaxID=118322 RepID=UPI00403DC382